MARFKPKASIQIQINEEVWTAYIWRQKSYEKQFGDDSRAITLEETHSLHYHDNSFDLDTIAHELWHAFAVYLHVESTKKLELSDIEEITASFMGKNFIKFYDKAHFIFNSLKEHV